VELLLSTLPGASKSPQVVEFLRHLPDKLLIIWDGLSSHRSNLVRDFVRQPGGRLWLEFLPAYAPRTQSGGISVGALEAARTTQLLSERLRPVERPCSSRAQADAPAPNPGNGLLAASATLSFVSILCGHSMSNEAGLGYQSAATLKSSFRAALKKLRKSSRTHLCVGTPIEFCP
jgi:hypothetical protein